MSLKFFKKSQSRCNNASVIFLVGNAELIL